jgi:hypothetical protein
MQSLSKQARPARVAAVALLLCIGPTGAMAQTYWRLPTAVGYTGLGLGAGVLAVMGVDLADATVLMVPGAAAVAGGILGYITGKSADDALSSGNSLSSGHKMAVRAGTVLTGAAVGLLPAILVINGEGSSSVSDETIFMAFVGGGALAATVVQILLEPKLLPNGRARAEIGLSPSGGPVALVRIPL